MQMRVCGGVSLQLRTSLGEIQRLLDEQVVSPSKASAFNAALHTAVTLTASRGAGGMVEAFVAQTPSTGEL